MPYPQTQSSWPSGNATGTQNYQTQASLSTQIIVQVLDGTGKKVPIGAIQSINPSETRSLFRVKEVGTDGVLEIVPNMAAEFQMTVTRLVFDQLRLPEAFARGFRHIHAQRLPFDIEVMDKNVQFADGVYLSTTYHNCWLTSYDYTYTQDNYLITENATVQVEQVYDYPGVNLVGTRNVVPQTDSLQVEVDANVGSRVGTLDSGSADTEIAPLINAVFS
jgi:hypothetical protein